MDGRRKAPGEPGPKNPVALSIESGAESEVKAAEGQTPGPGDLPVELEADRLQHPIETGGNLFLKGATVFTGHGEPLPETSILVKNGKIAAFGRDLAPEPGMTVIDVAGRFVMPGIIDTHYHVRRRRRTGRQQPRSRSFRSCASKTPCGRIGRRRR